VKLITMLPVACDSSKFVPVLWAKLVNRLKEYIQKVLTSVLYGGVWSAPRLGSFATAARGTGKGVGSRSEIWKSG